MDNKTIKELLNKAKIDFEKIYNENFWREFNKVYKEDLRRTELYDKNGREILLDDTIEKNTPYRNLRTNYSGKHIEILKPKIQTQRFVVKWGQGMFYVRKNVDNKGILTPLSWELCKYKTRDELILAFGGFYLSWEKDFKCLLENYPPKTEEELMEYISGCEVIDTEAKNDELLCYCGKNCFMDD